MTIVRLGYAAMSIHLKNASPSQTMTYTHFSKMVGQNEAIRKLETISRSNLGNCLRLLKYNLEHDIQFFRLSSRLIPLATHKDLSEWDYMAAVQDVLDEIRFFLSKNPQIRVDFHPEHFVLLNSPRAEVFNQSVKTLFHHRILLEGMGIDPEHRCVIHIGGAYGDKEKALEQFLVNWGFVPERIQPMIMLENDDKIFTVRDTLYLCEKIGLPCVFDLHHHEVNNNGVSWEDDWERIVQTWEHSSLPVKIHISSPRSETNVRAHADYIDPVQIDRFLQTVKGTVEQLDIMIEAKKKDGALFRLIEDLKQTGRYEWLDRTNFMIR